VKEILTELDQWHHQGEAIALATLVHVRGSTPRLPGARLCVTRSGRMAGSVSGGCVENDVVEHAMQVLDAGRPVVATYGVADELGLEVGLSCGGSIDVLIEPFAAHEAWQAARRAVEGREPAVLGIGLAPAVLLGRKLAVLADGSTVGSIDPEVDRRVAVEASRLLQEGGTRVLAVPRGAEDATVYIEAFPRPLRLFIVGATHTAIALCRMAKQLGFHVTVIDARAAYASRERFPDADALCCVHPVEVLDEAGLDASSYVLTLTHDPKFDYPALARALRSDARYIGALGSRGTHERRKAALARQGLADADLARIRAPIGLDLGGRAAEEVAVAILAEMQAVRYGRDARPLAHTGGGRASDARTFLSGVILAAGVSTRMGRPKQLLPFAGRPLLQHVVDAAAAARLDEIVLVLGHAAEEIRAAITLPVRLPVRVVVNPEPAEGQSASLRIGLGAADARATSAVVLLGDQPQVTRALIDRVAEAFLAGDAPAARPVWHGQGGDRIPGHPVFLARRLWPEVERLGGDQGARVLLAAHPEWLLEVACEDQPPTDIDDVDDYERAVDAVGTATIRG
jgi:xanthine dehydrogenase accessory factor